MTTRRTWLSTLAMLALIATPTLGDGPDRVTGRVVTTDGRPAAGAVVGTHWTYEVGNPDPSVREKAVADADGRFIIETRFHFGRARPILALAADGQAGGVVLVSPAQAKGPVEVKLGPLVRVHGPIASESAHHPLRISTTLAMLEDEGNTSVAICDSFRTGNLKRGVKPELSPPSCDFRLPAGDYLLNFIEPTEPTSHLGVAAHLTIKADQPGLDRELKPVRLPLTPLAAQSHKVPPMLRVKATRGVAADVNLADYRGRWVVLEFWSTTCGPCLRRGLPQMIDLWDDHAASRDKFAILAVCGAGADGLADMDRQLAPIVRDVWNGRELPFPILLDDDGRTFEAYGIQGIPATIVINPEGKLAPGGLEDLLGALPAVPVAVRVARALDRPIRVGMTAGAGAGAKLADRLEALKMGHEFAITLDPAASHAAGVTADTRVPLSLLGPVTLRTALRLLLEPLGLAAVPSANGLVVTTPPFTPPPAPTSARLAFQAGAADRLARRLAEPTTIRTAGKPLADVLDLLSNEVNESIVLDPIARRAGTIDPAASVTVEADAVPLGEILRSILAPLGLAAAIGDEVIVVRKAS